MRLRAHAGAYDKAGAYAIQGHAALWCAGIEGCYYNIMGCRFTARRSCCASLPDPDSPGNGSLYGKNLQLFYMLFRENTRYVYQRHRH